MAVMHLRPTYHIVKVQRPLSKDGEGVEMWLIYAEGSKFTQMVPIYRIPQHIKDAMAGRKSPTKQYRSFFSGAVYNKQQRDWDLSRAQLTQDQDW